MPVRMLFAITLASLTPSSFADAADAAKVETPGRLFFKQAGFSIPPLTGLAAKPPYQSMCLFLPAGNGAAPSVAVQVLPPLGSMANYVSFSKQRFKARQYSVLRANVEAKGAVLEYTGKEQGHERHGYEWAVAGPGGVYVATATASEQQWKEQGSALKACADSLKVKPGKSDGGYPFTIEAPVVSHGVGAYQVAILFLPPVGTAAAQVNLEVLAYDKSMNDYVALSRHRLEKSRLKSIREQVDGDALVLEYAGILGERRFHWYVRVLLRDGKSYLATATVPEEQWETVSGSVKACVDGLRLEVDGGAGGGEK